MWNFPFALVRPAGLSGYRVANTIGGGTFVRGDLRASGGFRIDGHVEGNIHADGPVIVGEKGSVDGVIVAANVVVLGRIRGDIHAPGHLEIGAAGKVIGDISIGSFRIHKGGTFRGTSRMASAEDLTPNTSPSAFLPAAPSAPSGRTLPPPGEGAVPPPARMREIPRISGAVAVAKPTETGSNPRRTLPLCDEIEDRAAV